MATQRDAVMFEDRRLQAVALYREGVHQSEIARRLGVTRQSVSRWIKTLRTEGRTALKRKPRPGRPPKLTGAERERLLKALSRGPKRVGYATELWTAERIRRLVIDKFGVRFHVHHIPKLLHQCGWSCQRPTSRASERDEEAIRRWVAVDWPRIKKKPRGVGRR